jgi:hypothetical protein
VRKENAEYQVGDVAQRRCRTRGWGNSRQLVVRDVNGWIDIFVSRYYNWHSGSFKNGYTHVGVYKLKKEAPDNAVDILSKNLVVPLLEKMLADDTVHEYEIDTQAIHTEDPGDFAIVYIASSPEGLDKVDAAVRDGVKASPLSGPAFESMTDFTAHRDELARTSATFK